MNDPAALERRYRSLLAAFPAAHRREYKEEMIGVLLASTPEGRRRPRLADALNLIANGLRTRLRPQRTGTVHANWQDALAVTSVAIPVTLLFVLAANMFWMLTRPYGWETSYYLPSLALALPALIALRYRRSAAVVALVAAAWFSFQQLRWLTVHVSGLNASYCLALLVQFVALSCSPGPRRAAAILTRKTWIMLCATGILGVAAIPLLWIPIGWQAVAVAVVFVAAPAGGWLLTLPRPVAVRVLVLLAIPAIPFAAWVVVLGTTISSGVVPFPELLPLPVLLLACVGAVAAWRRRRGGDTA